MYNKDNSLTSNSKGVSQYKYSLTEFCGIQTSKGRRAIEKLDLLLLTIEALDINAPISLTSISRSLELDHIFPNHVEIWKSRCHNPMRKSSRNAPINRESFDALLFLLSTMSQRFYPQIRQLLSSKDSKTLYEKRWSEFCYRFDDLISERMNIRRGAVKKYLTRSKQSRIFYKNLLFVLALSSGKEGLSRLRASIFEPLPNSSFK